MEGRKEEKFTGFLREKTSETNIGRLGGMMIFKGHASNFLPSEQVDIRFYSSSFRIHPVLMETPEFSLSAESTVR